MTTQANTTQANTTQTTLILGGAGKTGRRVAQRLTARGLPVRMASRSSEVPFDWNDERTWPGALVGVDAAYITYYPDISVPGAAEQVRRLSRLAVERGVVEITDRAAGDDERRQSEQSDPRPRAGREAGERAGPGADGRYSASSKLSFSLRNRYWSTRTEFGTVRTHRRSGAALRWASEMATSGRSTWRK